MIDHPSIRVAGRDRSRRFFAAALITLLMGSAVAGPTNLVLTYYDVGGNSARAIRTDINAHRPNADGHGYDGRTDWRITWQYQLMSDGTSCKVDSMDATLDVTMTLPRWTPLPRASEKLVAQWNDYDRALRTHEEGHQAIAMAAKNEIERSDGLTALVAADCKLLGTQLNAAATAIIDTHRKADAAYDASTDHGKTQGARFP